MAKLSDTLHLHRPRRQIVDLDWSETSGVDDPANLNPGWVVMKSKSGGAMPGFVSNPDVYTLSRLLKAERENIWKDQNLLTALAGADLSDAPPEIQQALAMLTDYLGQQYGTGAANSPAGPPPMAGPQMGAGGPPPGGPPGGGGGPPPEMMGKARKVADDQDGDEDGDEDDGEGDPNDVAKMTPKRLIKAMLDLFGINKTQKEILDGYTDTSYPPPTGDGSNKGYDEQNWPANSSDIWPRVLDQSMAEFQERLKKVIAMRNMGSMDVDAIHKAVDDLVDWFGGEIYKAQSGTCPNCRKPMSKCSC